MDTYSDIVDFWQPRKIRRINELKALNMPESLFNFLTTVGLPDNHQLLTAKLNIALKDNTPPFNLRSFQLGYLFHSPYFHFLPNHIRRIKFGRNTYFEIGQNWIEAPIALHVNTEEVFFLYEASYKGAKDTAVFVNSNIQSYLRCARVFIEMSEQLGDLWAAHHKYELSEEKSKEKLDPINLELKKWRRNFREKLAQIDPKVIKDSAEWGEIMYGVYYSDLDGEEE